MIRNLVCLLLIVGLFGCAPVAKQDATSPAIADQKNEATASCSMDSKSCCAGKGCACKECAKKGCDCKNCDCPGCKEKGCGSSCSKCEKGCGNSTGEAMKNKSTVKGKK